MRILLKAASLLTPVALVLAVIGVDAVALTNPATFAPRDFNTQQVGYFRVHIKATGNGIIANGLTCVVPVASASNCSVKVGALPANAFLLRMTQQIKVDFNASTTDTIGAGTTVAGVNVMAAATVHSGAGAISSPAFASGASGTLLTTGIPQTGETGGFPLWINYAYTGANVASAGELVWVLEYVAPNDGDCVATPPNVTPTSC